MKPLSTTRNARRGWLVPLALVALVLAAESPATAEESSGRSADVSDVLTDLGSPEPAERLAAAKHLPQMAVELWTRDIDATSAVILTALDDATPEVRRMAAVSLFQATGVLWGHVEVPAERKAYREEAAAKLGQLHPRLVDRLDDDDPIVREYLLRALGSWMPNVPAGLPTRLVDVVDDPSPKVAGLALQVLGRAGERSAAVISKLLAALDDRPDLRATAIGVLAELYDAPTKNGAQNRAPADILDRLSAATADPDEAVQVAAIRALGRVDAGSEPVRTLLQAHADGESERLRLEADRALGLLAARGSSGDDAGKP